MVFLCISVSSYINDDGCPLRALCLSVHTYFKSGRVADPLVTGHYAPVKAAFDYLILVSTLNV
ncbi:MAG: hypothetical protein ACTSYM_00490 [Candidatus Baldrarchaeia archaeon]